MAFSLGWHIILACFGVAFPAMIWVVHRRAVRRDDAVALGLAKRWSKVAAVLFAIGAVSGTITDASGRTLSGQTAEAFWYSVRHAAPLAIGLNCALGARDLRQHVDVLAQIADTHVSAHPNAGLPNAFGGYDESPEDMAGVLREFAGSGLLNLLGGCYGTTPAHIAAIADAMRDMKPRRVPHMEVPA